MTAGNNLLSVPNLCWPPLPTALPDQLVPPERERPGADVPGGPGGELTAHNLALVEGRFSVVHEAGGQVTLARDKLGLSKLFYALGSDGTVHAASYLADLLEHGFGLRAIYAVPAGSILRIRAAAHEVTVTRTSYHTLIPPTPASAASSRINVEILEAASTHLQRHFELLAHRFAGHRVAVCLSGGLDSSLVAAYATRYLSQVTAYTYTYGDADELSPDARAAQEVAAHLGLPFSLVPADSTAVLAALPPALRLGQDWRDFNVHCAIVNVLLADAIAADTKAARGPERSSPMNDPGRETSAEKPTLVLTGDLMNEITGDYEPLTYDGHLYYPLPSVSHQRLRVSLLRGLQCGDREVGVFTSRQLALDQPYVSVAESLLGLPGPVHKPDIIRHLAAGLLPEELYSRPKARAQIGGATATTGILPLLISEGIDGPRLESLYRTNLGIPQDEPLQHLIRDGVYRWSPAAGRST